MPYRRRRKRSTRIAAQATELALAVPQVMWHRLARLAVAGAWPSARDRNEFHRMGVEKFAAFYESWNAMFLTLLRANVALTFSPFQFWWSSDRSRRTGLAIFGAGLAPIHRRATANARRLRRKRIS
jgi:hypothetical protein